MDDDRAAATASRHTMTRASLVANLVGALVTFFYFRYIDVTASAIGPPGPAEIAFFAIAFALVAGGGTLASLRWTRPLMDVAALREPSPALRRRALLLPFGIAVITFLSWTAAGFLWGVLWPALTGTLTLTTGVRAVFGIVAISGVVTTAFIFFGMERSWRGQLAELFPRGGLATTAGVPRFSVRTRLIIVFLLVSVLPVVLVGVLAHTRAVMLADPASPWYPSTRSSPGASPSRARPAR